ncbi:hypothetical protein LQW54_008656 [Pestalotiopsis sp. IQ-011]
MTTVRLDNYDMIFDEGASEEADEDGVDVVRYEESRESSHEVGDGGSRAFPPAMEDDEIQMAPLSINDVDTDERSGEIAAGSKDVEMYDANLEAALHHALAEDNVNESVGSSQHVSLTGQTNGRRAPNGKGRMVRMAAAEAVSSEDELAADASDSAGAYTEGAEDVAAPVTLSLVARPKHQGKRKAASQTSSHLHISKKPRLDRPQPRPSPHAGSSRQGAIDMENDRLRARQAPKPVSAEMAEAIAAMDQEIRDEQPKKRGRGRPPKAAKNGHQAVVTAVKSGSASIPAAASGPGPGVKRRGRPPKKLMKRVPKLTPFCCEWISSSTKYEDEDNDDDDDSSAFGGGPCPAELQNLETLRRHVYIVHGSESAPYTCEWGKCASSLEPVTFDNEGAWTAHMEHKHLIPYSWHMGDGIQNRGIETRDMYKNPDKLPRYLFSADGRQQVTPSVRDQQFDDARDARERATRLHELRKRVDENAEAPEERERAYLALPPV